MMNGQFEKYVNLIRKSAHYYSAKYDIEYSEIESQGFLLYCECLENYDVSKSGFSTHLSWELKRLNDFCKTYKRQQGMLIEDEFKSFNDNEDEFVCEKIPATSENPTLANILEIAFKQLSKEAYLMLKWILGRTWEQKGRLKPSIALAMNKFNYTRAQAEKIWNEVGNFYNTTLMSL